MELAAQQMGVDVLISGHTHECCVYEKGLHLTLQIFISDNLVILWQMVSFTLIPVLPLVPFLLLKSKSSIIQTY
jgi:hypothetical protein